MQEGKDVKMKLCPGVLPVDIPLRSLQSQLLLVPQMCDGK